MNLLLLTPEDRLADGHWHVGTERARHMRSTLGLTVGNSLRAGLLNGPVGHATLLEDDGQLIRLRFTATGEAPAPLPLTLILALPRPKMLRRILIDATSLGIKRIVLLNSYKVDKSYWRTPELGMPLLEEKMQLGLAQAGDTHMPTLLLRDRFRPFVEDELPTLAGSSRKLIAHPANAATAYAPFGCTGPVTLAIGPEGGWTDYEFGRFTQSGFEVCQLGRRILRVETALPALVGRIMQLP